MQLTNALLATAALAGSALAAPAEKSASGNFYALSARSASPVHLLPFTVKDLAIVLGPEKPTTYCPSQVVSDCPPGNTTVFSVNKDGRAGMFTEVPGGQTLYVSKEGALMITEAHGSGPQDGHYTGFSYTPASSQGTVGNFGFSGAGATGFLACKPAGSNQYGVYANTAGSSLPSDCLGIDGITSAYTGSTAPTWQYD